ncbi:hypothetical protein [Vibrio parahaemolyticus]|uniref:hypothetical protein n=1 Tax=Vibrio parahaemolyticus TaxID=670 RepID=UPI00178374EA|nr:hypothetical protein [Vibrio parahaemolyticus]MBD6945695.1 hypothetical protein [Vibrio parahaemolyticus]MBD6979037.1 hypothetical protein [Vibrio parahaemolyticus]MBD6991748.1 hypothetical protein [Vibrio parahaemolyticus]
MAEPQNPIEIMISKLSELLGVIDGKLRNKLDKSGGTVDHLTVTNRLSATADHAHALKVARLFSLIGAAQGQVLFDGTGDAEITVTVPELANKADKSVTYTKDEVNQLFQNLIGLAPEELDTIYELAEALKGNQDSIGTIITELAKKANTVDVWSRTESDARFLLKGERAANAELFNGKSEAYYAKQTEFDATNQELSSVITQLTAAFQNGTNIIKG